MAPVHHDKVRLLAKPDLKPSPIPFIHESCQGELNKMYPTSSLQKVLKTQMQKRMEFYDNHPTNFFADNPLFEYFDAYNDHGTPLPIYVMRFNRNKILGNLRIGCVVRSEKIYLLHAFKEKKKADYDPAYEVTKTRLS